MRLSSCSRSAELESWEVNKAQRIDQRTRYDLECYVRSVTATAWKTPPPSWAQSWGTARVFD